MDTIRDFYVRKKLDWANSFDYYHPKRRWGEHDKYRFELAPPYSQEEVDQCLQSKWITLPSTLYQYLVLVSKEIFINSYPIIFDLETLPTKEQTSQFILPKDVDYVTEQNFQSDEDQSDDNQSNDNQSKTLFNPKHWRNLMVEIGDGGCAFHQYIYLGAGSQHGSIWYYFDDMCYQRQHESFDALLKADMGIATKT